MAGTTVPLHSAEHFYVVTEPIDGVHPDLPVLRDPDGYTYFKEEVGGLVVGGFEPEAKPWVSPDKIPYPFEFQLLEEDWEHFSVLMDSALHRIPALEETGIRKFYNGPESFTPDNQFLLGETPEVRGLFIGAGFNSRRHRVGRRCRAGPRGVDRERRGADRPDRRRRAAVRALQRQQPLAARPRRRGARPALLGAVAEPRDARPRGRSAARRCTTCTSRTARSSAARWAGSGRTSSRRPARRWSTPGRHRRGCRGRPPSRRPPGSGSRSSTRRRSRSCSSPAPTPSARCSGCAPPTSPCAPGPPSTQGC